MINDTTKAIETMDCREANRKVSYVYIISNIGAFVENVYEIGMTRCFESQDVDEKEYLVYEFQERNKIWH